MLLTDRLKACCDMAGRCETVTDIGCDHGYLPIWLIDQGSCKRAYACDINEGPLSKARENAARILEDPGPISFIRSDGLKDVPQVTGRDNVLVISGMGGPLIQKILDDDMDKAWGYDRFVFSPQSMIPDFRRFLTNRGFCIRDEVYVTDARKLYVIMGCCRGENKDISEIFFRFGPCIKRELLKNGIRTAFMKRRDELASLLSSRDLPEDRRMDLTYELRLYDEVLKS